MTAASSSQNATAMLRTVRRTRGDSLLDLFDVNVSGRTVARGMPAPDLLLLAADELGAKPSACFVVEDSPGGVTAARSAGMQVVGVARRGGTDALVSASATEISLHIRAYNMKRVMAVVGTKPLMEAIRA